jgi:hypothetical protein
VTAETSPRGPLLLVVVAAIVAATASLAPRLFPADAVTVTLDMRVSAGSGLEVFANDFRRPPAKHPLRVGERTLYRVHFPDGGIEVLRIDPTDVAGATVEIFGVDVNTTEGASRLFRPQDLRHWGRLGLTEPEIVGGGLRLVSTGTDPMLMLPSGTALGLGSAGPLAPIARLFAALDDARALVPVTLLGLVLLSLVFAVHAEMRLHALTGLAAVAAAVGLSHLALANVHGLPPIDGAVGRASFLGLSPRANAVAAQLSFAAALCIGALASRLARHSVGVSSSLDAPSAGEDDGTASAGGPISTWRRYGVPALAIALLFLVLLPDLPRALAAVTAEVIHANDWDFNNVFFWSYLAHEGGLPFRDYWYPYSGFYTFAWPAPTGLLVEAAYDLVLHAIFFLALYRLSDRRPAVALIGLVFVLAGERTGDPPLLWGADRYLLAVDVGLSYLTIDHERARLESALLWFWLACGLVLFFEPVQLLYAAPGIVAKLGFDILQSPEARGRNLIRRLVRELGVPALLALAAVALYAATGQLPGLVEFYGQLGQAATASALPTDLAADLSEPWSIQFLIYLTPFWLVAVGALERLSGRDRSQRLGDLFLILGLNGFMVLQKHLIRPLDWQLFLVPALAFFGYAMLRLRSGPPIGHVIVGTAAGLFLTMFLRAGTLADLGESLLEGPARLARDGALLLRGDPLLARAREERYSPERFSRSRQLLAVIDTMERALPAAATPKAYVLGDDTPFFYILLGQKPPYSVNNYNMSPIDLQERNVGWLEQERPDFVLWAPARDRFDQVPHTVRLPVLFDHVVRSYVPAAAVEGYDVLRRRTPGEPMPIDFWRARLGTTVEIGHLARIGSFASLEPCPTGALNDDCADFLEVETNGEKGGTRRVGFVVEGRPFELALETVAGERSYHVRLDRLWFYGPLEREGYAPTLATEELPDGTKVRIVTRKVGPEVLY